MSQRPTVKLPYIAVHGMASAAGDRLSHHLERIFPTARCARHARPAVPGVQILATPAMWSRSFESAARVSLEGPDELRDARPDSCGSAVAPERALFAALRSAESALGRAVIVLASIPDSKSRTSIHLDTSDETRFVEQLSSFVGHLEGVEAAVALLPERRTGWSMLRISEQRLRLLWAESARGRQYERVFHLDGAPRGRPRRWRPRYSAPRRRMGTLLVA